MLALLFALLPGAAHAEPALADALDASSPAADPPVDESIWDYIEASEKAPPAPGVAAASQELAQERLDELQYLGAVGAEPPTGYYLDPFAATALDPLHLDQVNAREFDIPIAVNDAVKGWMEYFLGRGRGYYTRYLQRSTKYIPMMQRELTKNGLPKDLVYLSMIESGFTTGATSYASAAGLWQFMPGTGRQYGLRIDYWVDERRDPEKATQSAIQYLGYLAKMFDGDWWLAWASYNGGEGRVQRATQRYGTTDFWTLTTKDALHPETENYVPKLIAAAIIGKHPDRYGFVNLKYEAEWSFDRVTVPASTGIDVLARCAGLSEESFVELNPALRRWALPPDPEEQSVRIPAGRKAAFEDAFSKIPPEERVTYARHVVRRGESIASIAKAYGVSADTVARVNRLKSTKSRLSVGMELIIPTNKQAEAAMASMDESPQGAASVQSSGSSATTSSSGSSSSTTTGSTAATPEKKLVVKTHTVAKGETLSGIASKYGLTLTELKSLNGITRNTAYAGEKLVVKKYWSTSDSTAKSSAAASSSSSKSSSASSSSSSKSSSTSASSGKTTTYTVRKGDTLSTIADRYGVTTSQLKAWNGLHSSTIYPGQRLKIKS